MNDDSIKNDNKNLDSLEEDTKEIETEEMIVDEDSELSGAQQLKKLRDKLKTALEEKQKYLDGWQRDKAEFVNARKRDEESRKEFIKFATENLVNDLISVLDSFDLAMGNKEAWEKIDKNWRLGIEHIANQLRGILQTNGLVELNPVGQPFDVNRDEAISYEQVDDASKDHIIISVIQKGYILNGKNLRPAKVKVGEFKQD